MTYQDLLNEAKDKIDRLDAELILGFVENKRREKIFSNLNSFLNDTKIDLFRKLVEKRKNGFPLAYITGKKDFWKSEFKVNSSVLIPRLETEELVRLMLKEDLDGKEIMDIGTGSGCIAISLAKNLSNAKLTALDISSDALEIARENARINNVDIEFVNTDIFEYKSRKKYDIIVSNPPYVLESEKEFMNQNVLDFEPELALFVEDTDSLKIYESIINFSKIYLKNHGGIFLEVNENKLDELIGICCQSGYIHYNKFLDFNKKNRYIFLKSILK